LDRLSVNVAQVENTYVKNGYFLNGTIKYKKPEKLYRASYKMKRGSYKLYLQDGSIPIPVTTLHSHKLRRRAATEELLEVCIHILNKNTINIIFSLRENYV